MSWFREGKPIKLDDMRFKSYELDECNYFEIDNLSILDAGEYTCTASNVMGAVFCAVDISIEGKFRALFQFYFSFKTNKINC